jgi:hypothetical protein
MATKGDSDDTLKALATDHRACATCEARSVASPNRVAQRHGRPVNAMPVEGLRFERGVLRPASPSSGFVATRGKGLSVLEPLEEGGPTPAGAGDPLASETTALRSAIDRARLGALKFDDAVVTPPSGQDTRQNGRRRKFRYDGPLRQMGYVAINCVVACKIAWAIALRRTLPEGTGRFIEALSKKPPPKTALRLALSWQRKLGGSSNPPTFALAGGIHYPPLPPDPEPRPIPALDRLVIPLTDLFPIGPGMPLDPEDCCRLGPQIEAGGVSMIFTPDGSTESHMAAVVGVDCTGGICVFTLRDMNDRGEPGPEYTISVSTAQRGPDGELIGIADPWEGDIADVSIGGFDFQ